MSFRVQDFYRNNPLMVSSPFGGVDSINKDLFLQVLNALDIDLSGRKILDVGCGRGYAGEVVTEAGGEYTGTDFVVSRSSGFRFAQAEAAALPFSDASFDAIFCIDAFEHFPDPDKAASEFRRLLKPDGFFFLSAPNYANIAGLVKKFSEAIGWYEKDTWAPFRNWQPQELESALTKGRVKRIFTDAGFRELQSIGHATEVGLGLFPWVEYRRMPEAIKFRLQRIFNAIGPGIVSIWPAASLHLFWKMKA